MVSWENVIEQALRVQLDMNLAFQALNMAYSWKTYLALFWAGLLTIYNVQWHIKTSFNDQFLKCNILNIPDPVRWGGEVGFSYFSEIDFSVMLFAQAKQVNPTHIYIMLLLLPVLFFFKCKHRVNWFYVNEWMNAKVRIGHVLSTVAWYYHLICDKLYIEWN